VAAGRAETTDEDLHEAIAAVERTVFHSELFAHGVMRHPELGMALRQISGPTPGYV